MLNAFGNTSSVNNSSPSWRSEPNGRGSWSILTSSLITIALCAWVALHLNVPEKGSKQQWVRKTKWFIIGVVSPEIVAFIAWRQRLDATELVRDLGGVALSTSISHPRRYLSPLWILLKGEQMASEATEPKSPIQQNAAATSSWTRVHGFYGIMGGLALATTNKTYLPRGVERLVLTPAGIRFLYEHAPELLPQISEEDIKDKSKADGLEKFLICAQAIWFCASSIARLANNLPITLLELNAIAHASCALLIYAFWWSKPLNIYEPTIMSSGDGLDEMIAYLWMSSYVSVQNEGWKGHDVGGGIKDEFNAIWPFEKPHPSDLIFQSRSEDNDGDRPNTDPAILAFPDLSRSFRAFESSHAFSGPSRWFACTAPKMLSSVYGYLPRRLQFPPGFAVRRTAIDHLSAATVERWRLAYRAIKRFGLEADLEHRHPNDTGYTIPYSGTRGADERVLLRVPNHFTLLPSPVSQKTSSSATALWLGFALAGLLYGGFHCAGWFATFASQEEAILWRLSAASIVVTPLIWLPFLVFALNSDLNYEIFGRASLKEDRKAQDEFPCGRTEVVAWSRKLPQKIGRCLVKSSRKGFMILVMVLGLVSPPIWACYVFGRVFLIVECFLNLAHLPPEAFKTVEWPTYVPHIA